MGNITWLGDTYTEVHHPPAPPTIVHSYPGWLSRVTENVVSGIVFAAVTVFFTLLAPGWLGLQPIPPAVQKEVHGHTTQDKVEANSNGNAEQALLPGRPRVGIEQRPTPPRIIVTDHP